MDIEKFLTDLLAPIYQAGKTTYQFPPAPVPDGLLNTENYFPEAGVAHTSRFIAEVSAGNITGLIIKSGAGFPSDMGKVGISHARKSISQSILQVSPMLKTQDIYLNIRPKPAARARKGFHNPKDYTEWKRAVAEHLTGKHYIPDRHIYGLIAFFAYPWPKSAKHEGDTITGRPSGDVDNLAKSIMDAMMETRNGRRFMVNDDKDIAVLMSGKIRSTYPGLIIRVIYSQGECKEIMQ